MQGPGWLSLASQGMGLCGTLAQTDIGLPKAMHNFSSLPETVLPPLSRLVRDGVFSGYPIAEQVVLPSIQPLSRWCPTHLPSNPPQGSERRAPFSFSILAHSLPESSHYSQRRASPPTSPQSFNTFPRLPASPSPRRQTQSCGPSVHGG